MKLLIEIKEMCSSILKRDPAAKSFLEVFFLYPGLHAVIIFRVANIFWEKRCHFLARLLSNIARFFTHIEIHPRAHIGACLFIDHGSGVIIGETAVIGDNVTIYQGVTLGSRNTEMMGKRHPTVGNNVIIGANSSIIGDITIGDNVIIGANTLVSRNIPSNCIVVGNPCRIINKN